MNHNQIIKTLFFGLAVSTMSLFSACKKYDNPPPVFEEYGALPSTNVRKVLVISIDGLPGAELLKINPVNIKGLVSTGKYNYEVLADLNSGSIPTWVTMMTGVNSIKHRVTTESFRPSPAEDEHEPVLLYPNFLYRILETKPEVGAVTVTSNAVLNRYFVEAERTVLTNNDAGVKDSVVKVLQNSKSSMVLANFTEVETVGLKDGFSAGVPTFNTAVTTVDGYIGEMMEAIKKRKDYAKEEWLVILTTNRGGSGTEPKPGFIICSNPMIKSEALIKQGFSTVAFDNIKTAALVEKDNGLYDGAANKDFTVQLQVKFNGSASWPGFFSKGSDVLGHNNTGWTMIFNGGNWETRLGGQKNGGGTYKISGANVADSKWHTLTLTVKTVGLVRTARMYTDGVLDGSADITGAKTLSSTEPLKVGYRNQDNGGTNLNFNAADVLYFNAALDPAVVTSNIALKDITKHPNYANLIGCWPIDEGAGGLVVNRATVGYNMKMQGNYKWVDFSSNLPASRTFLPVKGVSVVTAGADVASLLYYWLNIPVKTEWSIDGSKWLSKFEVEFLK